jgi:hypothetical protein
MAMTYWGKCIKCGKTLSNHAGAVCDECKKKEKYNDQGQS